LVTEPDPALHRLPGDSIRDISWGVATLGLAVFGLLWLLNTPYRQVYVPRMDDVTALADGLLLRPGAHWQDWFTRGHLYFFDAYPEWPHHETAFARPAFQFLIYLAHFVFRDHWTSYLAINYLGIAGVAAVAFAIGRTALGLSAGASAIAALLAAASPAVLESSIWEVGWASESLASVLVGCCFLALVARRNLLCLVFLMTALLTKETAVWAPFAAALTALLQHELAPAPRRRWLVAVSMLLPFMMWLALRFAFFGGIGGTYATAGYAPLSDFLARVGWKLSHVQHLFITQLPPFLEGGGPAILNLPIRIGSGLLVLILLAIWVFNDGRVIWSLAIAGIGNRKWPTAEPALLVTVWAVAGLVFYFALTITSATHAALGVMFAWPVVVSAVLRLRSVAFWLGLPACFVLSVTQVSHFLVETNLPAGLEHVVHDFRKLAAMNSSLRQVPAEIQQVYVISAEGLVPANPDDIQGFLGMKAELIRLVDMTWSCSDKEIAVSLDRESVGGVVTLSMALPACARFEFFYSGVDSTFLVDNRIRRSDTITYELPEAAIVDRAGLLNPELEPGRRMIAHIRPRRRSRFIVEHGGPDGGLAWFDIP
jgi:hypothetical protein